MTNQPSNNRGTIDEQLEQLSTLEQDWDTYGADPISLQAIEQTREFLSGIVDDPKKTPFLVPTNDGGIQIEWHEKGTHIEVQLDDTKKEITLVEYGTAYYEGDDSDFTVTTIQLDEDGCSAVRAKINTALGN